MRLRYVRALLRAAIRLLAFHVNDNEWQDGDLLVRARVLLADLEVRMIRGGERLND